MKKILFTLAAIGIIVIGFEVCKTLYDELTVCRADRAALLGRVAESENRCAAIAAEADRLTLTVGELRQNRRRVASKPSTINPPHRRS